MTPSVYWTFELWNQNL